MRRIGRVLWQVGPWLGMAAFAWRQQGLEARLTDWVQATNEAVQEHLGRLADVTARHVSEDIDGIVRPEG